MSLILSGKLKSKLKKIVYHKNNVYPYICYKKMRRTQLLLFLVYFFTFSILELIHL